MSAYSQFYQYPEQPQVSLTSNAFGYSQYDYPRSKTPASLVNHSGFSPGPLSTPPLSRNTSQPPEQLSEQPPEQMAWDDVVDSISDSPTSVMTPDNEAFDLDMLEAPETMRNFYENQNSAMMTTHVSHQALSALDPTMFFSDQAITEAFNGALAAQPQQYHTSFNVQSQTPLTGVAAQPYNRFYGEAYTRQPPRQDPWTGQGPPRNSNVAQPGIAVFDPASDTMNYNDFGSFDEVADWRMNNTDPNYLVSPNDPVAPTHDNLFCLPLQSHALVYPQSRNDFPNHFQNHNPVGMTLTLSSPTPASQSFVNYNSAPATFRDDFTLDPQFPPPPSPVASSVSHGALSPYQAPISPQGSALSPDGSEGTFSYQQSDGDMLVDSSLREHFEPQPSPSPVQVHHAPRRVSNTTLGPSSEPGSRRSRSISRKGKGGRPGGRSLGTHLDPKVAKAAHDMRKIAACWHCVLQRDKCGPGDVCGRCVKRSQRPNADCGIGCVRDKLVTLIHSFLPTLVTQMHEDSHLTHFVSQYIHQWQNVEITIYMTCGQKTMPRIPVKVYEFVPKGDELLVQVQYQTDPKTLQRVSVKKKSPALGMVHINHNEEKKYDKYINDIVDNHLDDFGLLCWAEDDNDFQEKLFKLMTRLKPQKHDEAKLFREVFRLIVCTFIMSHTLTIAEETKDRSLSKMHSWTGRDAFVAYNTSPRMTNRQLKYFFSRLQRSIMNTILNKLQQIYKSSRGIDKWLPAFVVVVGMCMVHEDQQQIIHQTMATKATTERTDPRDAQARADIACREIDAKMHLIKDIFWHKYHRKCNPFRDPDLDWEHEAGFTDPGSAAFVRQVAQLVKENVNFLQRRQNISISVDNQSQYTSRLVGQFLLSLWLPI